MSSRCDCLEKILWRQTVVVVVVKNPVVLRVDSCSTQFKLCAAKLPLLHGRIWLDYQVTKNTSCTQPTRRNVPSLWKEGGGEWKSLEHLEYWFAVGDMSIVSSITSCIKCALSVHGVFLNEIWIPRQAQGHEATSHPCAHQVLNEVMTQGTNILKLVTSHF